MDLPQTESLLQCCNTEAKTKIKKAQQLFEEYKSQTQQFRSGPTFGRVDTLQAEEAARKKAEEERRKAEEERKKRQQEKMNDSNCSAVLQASKDALASCAEAIDSGAIEMADMVLEQGLMVIEAEEIEMAGDVILSLPTHKQVWMSSKMCVVVEARSYRRRSPVKGRNRSRRGARRIPYCWEPFIHCLVSNV